MQLPSPRPDDPQATDPQTWLDAYGDYLYRYALLRVRDESLAEDLVQEILLAALKGWAGFDGRSSERTWPTGILKHKIVDQLPVTQKGDTSMLNCQGTSRLIPQNLDRPLTSKERLSLRLHLLLCGACRGFARQLRFLRQAMADLEMRTLADDRIKLGEGGRTESGESCKVRARTVKPSSPEARIGHPPGRTAPTIKPSSSQRRRKPAATPAAFSVPSRQLKPSHQSAKRAPWWAASKAHASKSSRRR